MANLVDDKEAIARIYDEYSSYIHNIKSNPDSKEYKELMYGADSYTNLNILDPRKQEYMNSRLCKDITGIITWYLVYSDYDIINQAIRNISPYVFRIGENYIIVEERCYIAANVKQDNEYIMITCVLDHINVEVDMSRGEIIIDAYTKEPRRMYAYLFKCALIQRSPDDFLQARNMLIHGCKKDTWLPIMRILTKIINEFNNYTM